MKKIALLSTLVTALVSASPVHAVDWPVVHDDAGTPIQSAAQKAPAGDAAEATPEVEAQTAEAAKPTPPPPPPVTLKIAINLSSQRLTVTENGKAKYTWKISSGRSGYLTPTGNYRPQWMARMWNSRKYDWAPMPHSIFFHRGYAIHATYATGRLGRPASHGCIRLSPRNAKTLYRLVSKHGKASTRISIRGHAKQYRQRYVKRKPRRVLRRRYMQAPPSYQYSYRRAPRGAYGPRYRRYRQVYRAY